MKTIARDFLIHITAILCFLGVLQSANAATLLRLDFTTSNQLTITATSGLPSFSNLYSDLDGLFFDGVFNSSSGAPIGDFDISFGLASTLGAGPDSSPALRFTGGGHGVQSL